MKIRKKAYVGGSLDACDANARLIAAAPALLEACRDTRRALVAIDDSRGEPITDDQRAAVAELRRVIGVADAAISLARGES